jgi:hypothetical protein
VTKKFAVYRQDVASQIGSVAEAWFGQEPDEIDFMYDLSMADGSIQYVVRAVFGAVSKFLLVRVYGIEGPAGGRGRGRSGRMATEEAQAEGQLIRRQVQALWQLTVRTLAQPSAARAYRTGEGESCTKIIRAHSAP